MNRKITLNDKQFEFFNSTAKMCALTSGLG